MVGESFDYEFVRGDIHIVYEESGKLCDAVIEVSASRTEIKMKFLNGHVSDTFHRVYSRPFDLIEVSGIEGNEKFGYLISYFAVNHKDELRKI